MGGSFSGGESLVPSLMVSGVFLVGVCRVSIRACSIFCWNSAEAARRDLNVEDDVEDDDSIESVSLMQRSLIGWCLAKNAKQGD